MTSRLLLLALLAALIAAVVTADGGSSPEAAQRPLAAAGGSPGGMTPGGQMRRRPGVAGMSQKKLEVEARRVARHGGILGTCSGCATPRMQRLSLELVMRAFPPGSKAWAVCVTMRESGANPGAISPSHDFGLGQIHVAAHPQFSAWRLTHDPVYSTRAFVQLSQRGRKRQPWEGGRYAC